MHRPRTHQRGVALVSVLLIVAILLAVVTRLMANHNLVINQHQNTFEYDQALQYALGAETLARQALYEDLTVSGPDSDHLEELWAQPTMPFELDDGGFLEAQLRDLQGCFNINSVADGEAQSLARFKRLLNNLGLQPQVAEAWKDWIDDDQQITGFGAEDSEYLLSVPPHRTPDTLVLHPSELMLLQNMNREQFDMLIPFICALPNNLQRLNVNTVNAQALAALHEDIAAGVAENIVTGQRNFSDVDEFVASFSEFEPVRDSLAVRSEYFELHAQAQVGSTSVTLLSVLHRDPSSGIVTVLQRDFGKLFRSNVTITTEES